MSLAEHPPQGASRDGTACLPHAEVTDLLEARGEDMLQEAAATRAGSEVGGARSCTAGFTVGDGDGTLREGDDAAVGERDYTHRGGKGREGGVAGRVGLALDLPGDGPDLWVELLQKPSLAQGFGEEGPGDGRERLNGDQEGDSGGEPLGTVCGEAATRADGVEVRMGRELPAPGREETGTTRESGADATLVCGEACEGGGRSLAQGVVGNALMCADTGSQGLRAGNGAEAGRPWKLWVQMVLEPQRGWMRLTLGAVAIAACMVDAVLMATALALIQAVAIGTAWAVLHGPESLAVRQGQMGGALQVLRRVSLADILDGGYGRSPCLRALLRV